MTYTIRYQQAQGEGGGQHWTASLLEAKLHASEVVKSGSAERAEVADAAGQVVYRFPECEDEAP